MMPCRILIVEDDDDRLARLKAMMPEWVRPVSTVSAGRALGLLERDSFRNNGGKDSYAGILLDHDLDCHAVDDNDSKYCGRDVVESVIRNVTPNVPVLIHSMNIIGSKAMVDRLEGAGFLVTKIPMSRLTGDSMVEWLETVREQWEDTLD